MLLSPLEVRATVTVSVITGTLFFTLAMFYIRMSPPAASWPACPALSNGDQCELQAFGKLPDNDRHHTIRSLSIYQDALLQHNFL